MLIDELTPVTMFNEVAVLDGGPNAMTAIAARDCVVWQADYTVLLALAERYPQVALGFLPVLAERTRVLISMVTDICFRSVRARTAKLILDLSEWGEQPISRHDHSIQSARSDLDRARSRQRALSYFREQAYSHLAGDHLVKRPDQLAALAEIDCLARRTGRCRNRPGAPLSSPFRAARSPADHLTKVKDQTRFACYHVRQNIRACATRALSRAATPPRSQGSRGGIRGRSGA